jgi:hypothetical protein
MTQLSDTWRANGINFLAQCAQNGINLLIHCAQVGITFLGTMRARWYKLSGTRHAISINYLVNIAQDGKNFLLHYTPHSINTEINTPPPNSVDICMLIRTGHTLQPHLPHPRLPEACPHHRADQPSWRNTFFSHHANREQLLHCPV